jgi:hypothetical protein
MDGAWIAPLGKELVALFSYRRHLLECLGIQDVDIAVVTTAQLQVINCSNGRANVIQ